MFITFEGGEGAGKSLQSKLLADKLLADGYDVVLTREPGGTAGAESIRSLLLKGAEELWGAFAESLLYLAARADHWEKIIKPALCAGKIVISDRFQDSTLVYQGYCKGVSIDILNIIFEKITQGFHPDRTYLLAVDPKVGLTRSINRKNNDELRFENMDIRFHENVLRYFLNLAGENNKRFKIIDGTQSVNDIANEIYCDFKEISRRN